MRKPIRQRLAVESQPSARAAQANAAELGGVLVDPISLDVEEPGNVGRIDEPRSTLGASARPHKLGDPLGDLLDVVGV